MDYYGTMLATASSDKTVRIFSVECRTGAYQKLAELTGYDGPVINNNVPSVNNAVLVLCNV